MPQIQVFQCPACGANLNYAGGPEISFACQFCGTTVIVPEEMRSKTTGLASGMSGNYEARIKKVLADSNLATLDPELLELVELELPELIKDEIQATGVARGAQLNEILRLARSGKKPEALNLFRQAYPTMSTSEAEQAVKILGSGSVS